MSDAMRTYGCALVSHPVANGTIDHTERAGQMLIDGARELAAARAACAQAAQALASWRRAYPDAWGLQDQVALAACVRVVGAA